MGKSETITWVDEYDNVHAVVPIPTMFGRLSEDEYRKARRRAGYAIRRELKARSWPNTGPRVRLREVDAPASIAMAIEFVEDW